MTERLPDRRRRTYEAGRAAELLALLALTLKGFWILARRYVVNGGEIDIVARRGRLVLFIEVKARPTREEALLAVTASKRRRIERAAATWLARNSWAAGYDLRGDAVLIVPGRWPQHVADAFPLRIG
jgi:putative endonuclease